MGGPRVFPPITDKERSIARKFLVRNQRCMFFVLLGYLKAKPVVIRPGFHSVKTDFQYVAQKVFSGAGHRPFNLSLASYKFKRQPATQTNRDNVFPIDSRRCR